MVKKKKVSKWKQKVVSKRILKPSKIVVKIPEYKPQSVLGDENRFFTGEMNQVKKEMFFS